MKKFFGKYRGKVENNIDPMMLGRLQVSAPAVLGDGSFSWAMPCVPFAGPGVGLFLIPPVGANVWVEFEGGNPDYPIWSGCFWGIGEVPALPALEQMKVFKTDCVKLEVSDLPGIGGVTLEIEPPAVAMPLKMVFNSSGIEISNEPVKMTMNPTNIELTAMPAKIVMSPEGVAIESTPNSAKITAQGIELGAAPSTAKVSPQGIELDAAPASVKLSSAGIELANAAASGKFGASGVEIVNGAASVELTAASVSINKGALEVI